MRRKIERVQSESNLEYGLEIQKKYLRPQSTRAHSRTPQLGIFKIINKASSRPSSADRIVRLCGNHCNDVESEKHDIGSQIDHFLLTPLSAKQIKRQQIRNSSSLGKIRDSGLTMRRHSLVSGGGFNN